MITGSIIDIQTPHKVRSKGLWFGPKKPHRVIVWVHGLGSSAFSMLNVVEKLADSQTAVLTFNNRGHDVIHRMSRSAKKNQKTQYGGAAHEKFTECIDDINGALRYARKQGVKDIILAGHSTGCQKSIYWAAHCGKKVKGIILLAPVSDYAAGITQFGIKKVIRATAIARALVTRGKHHELLPRSVWPEILDAQRFLSLYTPDSVEEIFPYAQKGKRPALLHKVKIPILALWAGKEEYSDHPAKEVARWFSENICTKKSAVHVISHASHSFKGSEGTVVRIIQKWISNH